MKRKNVIVAFLILLVLVLSVLIGQYITILLIQRDDSISREDLTITKLLTEINKFRASHKLAELKFDPRLIKTAKAKAELMLNTNCWSHYCPDLPWHFYDEEKYDYRYASENLARNQNTAQEVIELWRNSAPHLETMMSQKYTDVGFYFVRGEFQGVKNAVIIVAHFGSEV